MKPSHPRPNSSTGRKWSTTFLVRMPTAGMWNTTPIKRKGSPVASMTVRPRRFSMRRT